VYKLEELISRKYASLELQISTITHLEVVIGQFEIDFVLYEFLKQMVQISK